MKIIRMTKYKVTKYLVQNCSLLLGKLYQCNEYVNTRWYQSDDIDIHRIHKKFFYKNNEKWRKYKKKMKEKKIKLHVSISR